MKTTEAQLTEAYQFCHKLAQSHYENFPVASLLLPKKLRRAISVIYAFARTADDFADEGEAPPPQRLAQLASFDSTLQAISNNSYHGNDPIFIALADVITQYELPISLFTDLLSAFAQDVSKRRYTDFAELLDYCRRSANPIGRLLLLLTGEPSEQQLVQSDQICTALQLINFYQDIIQDLTESDRIYLPTDEMAQFGVKEHQLNQDNTSHLAELLQLQYQRAQALMESGAQLGNTLTGRIGWEVRAMTLAGISTLAKLIAQDKTNLLSRPRLTQIDMIKIVILSVSKQLYWYYAQKLLTK